MASSAFPPRHRWDRAFFVLFVLAGWAAVWMGFAGEVAKRFRGEADYAAPLILLVHIAAFAAWMALLTVQVLLIETRRLALHRKLGLLGLLLLPVMIVSAIGAEIYSQRFYSPRFPGNLNFFVAPLMQMIAFGLLAAGAFLRRGDAAAHKRLILLATSIILVAAYNRWWGEALYERFGDGFWGMIVHNFAGPDLLILIAMLYDLLTRGRVHRVYLIAAPAILAAELAASVIYHSAFWPGVVRSLVGL
jgi:uncharacterized membrane protein